MSDEFVAYRIVHVSDGVSDHVVVVDDQLRVHKAWLAETYYAAHYFFPMAPPEVWSFFGAEPSRAFLCDYGVELTQEEAGKRLQKIRTEFGI